MRAGPIDLNCDLGERNDSSGVAADRALLELVTSANIACGGHAGDEASMVRTVTAAMECGVALGAHPGYEDRENFGRVPHAIGLHDLEDSIAFQVDALAQIIDRCGGRLAHVKAHGALYHAAMHRHEIAEVVARASGRVSTAVILVGQAAAPALEVWRAMGFRVAAEAFADRRNEADGSLRDRREPGALIDDPSLAADQAVRLATGASLVTRAGALMHVEADTLCLHGDSPNAIEVARAVRDALVRAGVGIQALRR